MYFLVASVCGYLFGCINGSQLIGKYKQVSVKQEGMKNAGATNTTLVLGFKYGLAVLFIDIMKVIFSLLFISILLNENNVALDMHMLLLYINGFFVILGHNFPATMNFSGGKGTAAFYGFLLYIDWRFAVMGFIMMLIFAFISNYFVVGTFLVYISFNAYTTFTFDSSIIFISLLFTFLFLIMHKENYKRIIQQEEIKVSALLHREAS